jgi:hypothetical protein
MQVTLSEECHMLQHYKVRDLSSKGAKYFDDVDIVNPEARQPENWMHACA